MYELDTPEGFEAAVFDLAVPLASGLLANVESVGWSAEAVTKRAFDVAVSLVDNHRRRMKAMDMEAVRQ